MKNFKSKIFNFKKYFPIITILVLFVSALALALIDFSNIKIGQAKYCSDCQETENVETEYISQNMTCSNCRCEQAGKKIFSFYGTEADCENMETEKDRSACYAKHSLKEQTCGHIADNNSKRECLDRFTSMTYKYYLGPGGTLVNQNNVTIKGDTTILNGFDKYGEHKLMTGVDEGRDLFITFRRKSGDVEFNNNLFVPGDLRINSAYGGVYFGSELVFDNMIYENGNLSSWKNPPKFAEATEQPFSSPTTHDDDEDGVNNRDDNCRDDPNPGQQDYDGDGIGDACDPMTGFPPSPSDSDGDGVPDAYDNCPTISNISQLDTDSDGIGDACDITPAPTSGDADNDGVYVSSGDCDDSDPTIYPGAYDIPGDGIDQDCDGQDAIITPPLDPLDTDGDTIPNINDNCPNDYNPSQADSDGDGIGDACESIPLPSCSGVSYAGEFYGAVQVGSQCWMTKNLNVGQRIDGVEDMTNNGTIEKYCYGDNPNNCNIYGGLYQWSELRDDGGICPSGWHVPSDAEWHTLESYFANDPVNGCDPNRNWPSAGDWWDCDPAGTILKSWGGTMLSGYISSTNSFYGFGEKGTFWSSSMSGSNALARYFRDIESEVGRASLIRSNGFSVRCIRD